MARRMTAPGEAFFCIENRQARRRTGFALNQHGFLIAIILRRQKAAQRLFIGNRCRQAKPFGIGCQARQTGQAE